MDFLLGISPVFQALIATGFTWFVTALGAALVFFFKTINRKILDSMLGFAAGVMIAAGAMIYVVVEELIPEAQSSGDSDFATIGTMLGFAVMMLLDVSLG